MKQAKHLIVLLLSVSCSYVVLAQDLGDNQALSPWQRAYVRWTNEAFCKYLSPDDHKSVRDIPDKVLAYVNNDGHEYDDRDKQKWRLINSIAANREKNEAVLKKLVRIATENVAKDNRERWMAIRAIAIVGNDSVVPALIPLLYHYNSNTRFWTQIALVELTGQNFGADFEKWIAWYNSQSEDRKISSEKTVWRSSGDIPEKHLQIDYQRKIDKDKVIKLLGKYQCQ